MAGKLFGLKYDNLDRYLDSYAKYILRQARHILKTREDTGNLSGSLDYSIYKKSKGYDIRFFSAAYGDYLDKGVSGNQVSWSYIGMDGNRKPSPYRYTNKMPPVDTLVTWIQSKGMQGRYKKEASGGKGGQFMSHRSLGFAIAKSIQKKGLKGLSFFSQPISYSFNKFQDELEANFAKDLEAGMSIKI